MSHDDQSHPRIVIEDLPEIELLSEEEAARIFGAGRVRLGIERTGDAGYDVGQHGTDTLGSLAKVVLRDHLGFP